jgi:hypothetical protein
MRYHHLSAILGLSVLGFLAPQAEASWLSQAQRRQREPAIPRQYMPPGGYGVPNGNYRPGPYYQPGLYQAPSVQSFIPNISGTWFMNGNPYAPCQIIQVRMEGSADFVNEHGSRTCGTVNGDHVWIPEWSDGTSRGLSGWIRGDRIIWPNGTFWSR